MSYKIQGSASVTLLNLSNTPDVAMKGCCRISGVCSLYIKTPKQNKKTPFYDEKESHTLAFGVSCVWICKFCVGRVLQLWNLMQNIMTHWHVCYGFVSWANIERDTVNTANWDGEQGNRYLHKSSGVNSLHVHLFTDGLYAYVFCYVCNHYKTRHGAVFPVGHTITWKKCEFYFFGIYCGIVQIL